MENAKTPPGAIYRVLRFYSELLSLLSIGREGLGARETAPGEGEGPWEAGQGLARQALLEGA